MDYRNDVTAMMQTIRNAGLSVSVKTLNTWPEGTWRARASRTEDGAHYTWAMGGADPAHAVRCLHDRLVLEGEVK